MTKYRGMLLLTLVVMSSLCVINAQQTCLANSNGCQYSNIGLTSTTNDHPNLHYYIGGLFGIHDMAADAYSCQDAPFRDRGMLNMEAFHWAIKEYGTNPNVSIGGVSLDSCSRVEQTLENLLSFETCKVRFGDLNPVTPRNLLAYVGPDRSSEAMATATLLKDMNKTQVTHAATSPKLSNKELYPFLLRSVPSDKYDAEIIAEMLEKMNIRYVLGVYLGNAYGRDGFQALKNELDDTCVVYETEMPVGATPQQLEAIADELILRKVTRYVVVYADAENARILLNAIQIRNPIEVQNFYFVGTSSWGNNTEVTDNLDIKAYTLALSTPTALVADVDRFYQYLDNLKPSANTWNPWFQAYWNEKLGCNTKTCNELTDTLAGRYSQDVYVPYTVIAVKAIIEGVRTAALSYCGKNDLCSALLNQENRGQRINGAIGQTSYFTDGELSNVHVSYRILNFKPDSGYSVIGTFTPGSDLTLNAQEAMSNSCPESPCLVCGELPPSPPTTTTVKTTEATIVTTTDPTEGGKYKFIKFMAGQHFTGVFSKSSRMSNEYGTRFEIGQRWIIALGVLAGVGCVAVLVFEIYILFKLIGTRIGRQWRTMWLGQLLLFGIFLSYLTLFAFLFIPTSATCGIIRFGIGVSYAIIYSVLLVKLMVILTSTTTESLVPGDVESPNYLKGIYQFLMFIFAVGVQVVIDTQWLIQVPPEAVKVMTNSGDEGWICNHFTWSVDHGWDDMSNFVRTEFENHLLSLVYVMFLIVITTIVAMRAHGIITNHRESVFIGIAAGFSIPIWISWGLVGGLNRDITYGHQFGDACLAFGLFVCATLALFAMFLPKVRQLINMGVEGIYLEDDRDTYYAGSVIMAPPSYKSRPSSVVYANAGGIYSDPVLIGNGGDPNAIHLKHPGSGSTYSAPVYMKKGETYGTGSIGGSKVLRVTGDLTGKMPNKPASEIGHYRKTRSESGGTLRKATSTHSLGAL